MGQLSLRVTNNVIETTSPGCQVISARYPVPLTGPSYFEAKIISNPSAMRGSKGGMAIGVSGHIPTGKEYYTVRFDGAICYSSGNGLVGKDTIGASNVQPGVSFVNDSTFGVKYDPYARTLTWYQNKLSIGQCAIATAE